MGRGWTSVDAAAQRPGVRRRQIKGHRAQQTRVFGVVSENLTICASSSSNTAHGSQTTPWAAPLATMREQEQLNFEGTFDGVVTCRVCGRSTRYDGRLTDAWGIRSDVCPSAECPLESWEKCGNCADDPDDSQSDEAVER